MCQADHYLSEKYFGLLIFKFLNYFLLFFLKFIYFEREHEQERGREREREGERERERERERMNISKAGSAGSAQSPTWRSNS